MLVVKLGRGRVDELVENGLARPFDPSGRGRPMKDWASVSPPSKHWLDLLKEASRREGA
jgi:hypothetical protein